MASGNNDGKAKADKGRDTVLTQFGAYLRSQRQLARMSLRDLSELTRVSNPYLSQLERGMHQPSLSVLKNLSSALNVSLDVLTAQLTGETEVPSSDTEQAIRQDARLSKEQKSALLAVYRAMVHGDSD